jgi:hypothetical protein
VSSDIDSGRTEAAISKIIFDQGGVVKQEFQEFPGVKAISAMIEELEDR